VLQAIQVEHNKYNTGDFGQVTLVSLLATEQIAGSEAVYVY